MKIHFLSERLLFGFILMCLWGCRPAEPVGQVPLSESQIVSNATNEERTAFLLDSVLSDESVRPFNGVLLLAKNGKPVYEKAHGFVNAQAGAPLELDHQFVIGSISKQITAVLLLRQFDLGRIDLHAPASNYLVHRQEPWLDSISAHQLMNHTSGVVGLNQPLKFPPGQGFKYSGTGFQLVADLVEAVSGLSFDENALVLFQELGMFQTKFPFADVPAKLLRGYSAKENESVQEEEDTFYNTNIAAGLMISSAPDLLLWNQLLHGGKLLKPSSYALMTKASSQRDHPIYGEVSYGYGLQIEGDDIPQIGHSGYAPGFVSTNYHFPKAQLDLIVLENLDWEDESFKKTFHCEQAIRNIVANSSWAE